MANNYWKWPLTCVVMALAAGCGGSSQPEQPADPEQPPVVHGLGKLELLTGKVSVDFTDCRSTAGPAATAEYAHLLRAAVYQDAVYLTETGENCANMSFGPSNLIPNNLQPAILKLSGGVVKTVIALNTYLTFTGMPPPEMVRYPSGFYRNESTGESFVLSYVAASSDRFFALDEQEVARYTAQGGWNYYRPGLFKFSPWQEPTQMMYANDGRLVAGTHSQPPAYADGQGNAASFVAPHDLEADASGLFYLIDNGQIRTIDSDYQVKTLDLAALGIEGDVKALDSDRQGRIHVLTSRGGGYYSWYRLADGSRVDYEIGNGQATFFMTAIFQTFTVAGDDLVVGQRLLGSGFSDIYRVSPDGTVTPLSGNKTPASSQELLDDPAQYRLPEVEHVKYGLDGNLYIVLAQGVLVARDFK